MVTTQTNGSTADAAIVIGSNSPRTFQAFSAEVPPVQRNLIVGTDGPDIIFGTPGDDEIRALGGDDTIIGTTGNDLIDGGDGFDTVDYSNLGQAITLLPRGAIGEGNSNGGQLISIERIIGPTGQKNTIDGSSATGGASFDINLAANRLTVNNVPNIGTLTFTVENFDNVTGTAFDDVIVGNDNGDTLIGLGGNDTLTGGRGNDVLIGGSGNDILQGSIGGANRNPNEQDILTGGGGSDRFILGDASGSFYKSGGDNDFAQITDFSFGNVIQLGSGDVYNIQRNDTGFNIFAVTDGINDLIAKVTLGSATASARTTNAAFAASAVDGGTDSVLNTLPTGNFQVGSGEKLGVFLGA